MELQIPELQIPEHNVQKTAFFGGFVCLFVLVGLGGFFRGVCFQKDN